MTEYVQVAKEEYEEMLTRIDWLECLESAGVDNWEGFDYAVEIYNSEDAE